MTLNIDPLGGGWPEVRQVGTANPDDTRVDFSVFLAQFMFAPVETPKVAPLTVDGLRADALSEPAMFDGPTGNASTIGAIPAFDVTGTGSMSNADAELWSPAGDAAPDQPPPGLRRPAEAFANAEGSAYEPLLSTAPAMEHEAVPLSISPLEAGSPDPVLHSVGAHSIEAGSSDAALHSTEAHPMEAGSSDPAFRSMEAASLNPALHSMEAGSVDPAFRSMEAASLNPAWHSMEVGSVDPALRSMKAGSVDSTLRSMEAGSSDPALRSIESGSVDRAFPLKQEATAQAVDLPAVPASSTKVVGHTEASGSEEPLAPAQPAGVESPAPIVHVAHAQTHPEPAVALRAEVATVTRPTTDDGEPLLSHLIETMKWQAQGGGGQVDVRLRPEVLGALSISVVVEGDAVRATVKAETREALEYLQSESAALQSALEERGLTLDEFEVTDLDADDGRSSDERERSDAEARKEASRRHRQRSADGPAFEVFV